MLFELSCFVLFFFCIFEWRISHFIFYILVFFVIQMVTINDILYYLNNLDFTDQVTDDDFETLGCVKRILVREVEDNNPDKLIQVLCLVDRLMVLTTTGTLDDILDSTHTLWENFFF